MDKNFKSAISQYEISKDVKMYPQQQQMLANNKMSISSFKEKLISHYFNLSLLDNIGTPKPCICKDHHLDKVQTSARKRCVIF